MAWRFIKTAVIRHQSVYLSLLFASLLAGCARPVPVDTLNLAQIQQWSANTLITPNGNISSIRLQALEDTALSVGARSGLAFRSLQINALLNAQAKTLDRIFNFNGLLLEHNVLPPVLVEGRHDLNLADDMSIRLSDRIYKIESQARFVTAAPNWRSYLWMGYDRPAPPDHTLLPRNRAEDQIWRTYVALGWKNGMVQGNHIYAENLNRLRRDYQGMLLYRQLLTENMVSLPFVAKADLGITSTENSMRINDQVLRITALPQLQINSATWNPVIVKEWRPQNHTANVAP